YVSQLLVNTPLRPHISTLFPYTTLFRSPRDGNFRISTTDRVPDRGDDRDAVSARRGVAHRRYLGLHRAPATRAPRKAAGFRLHQCPHRPHRGAAARSDRKSTRLNSSH